MYAYISVSILILKKKCLKTKIYFKINIIVDNRKRLNCLN